MSEDHLSLTRRIVNSVWKAVRVLEERSRIVSEGQAPWASRLW